MHNEEEANSSSSFSADPTPSEEGPTEQLIGKRTRTRNPIKLIVPEQTLVDNLPGAIIYTPQTNMGAKANAAAYTEAEDWVQIGDFKINIEDVTKPQLIKMRKFLP
jgi:hypothetical protein